MLLGVMACARATPSPTPGPDASAARPAHEVADSVRNSYTPADVEFMQGMIHHHAQALVMARMAPTHGASPTMMVLTARIINAQKDEIALMQRWLRNREQTVPEVATDSAHLGMEHGEHMSMSMPGMLTEAQLAQLDAARGPEFDRLFLVFMIQHHRGALTMVRELFSSYGAAQEDRVFKLASDIEADQGSEVERMRKMLNELNPDFLKTQ